MFPVQLPLWWLRVGLFTVCLAMTVATLAGSAVGAGQISDFSGFGAAIQAFTVGVWLSLVFVIYPFPRLATWMGAAAALVFATRSWLANSVGFSDLQFRFSDWRGVAWLATAGLLVVVLLTTRIPSRVRSATPRLLDGLAVAYIFLGLVAMTGGTVWAALLTASADEFRAQAQAFTGQVTEIEYASILPTAQVRIDGKVITVPYVTYPLRVGANIQVRVDPTGHRAELVEDPRNTYAPVQAAGFGLVLCASGCARVFSRRRIAPVV